MTDDELTREKFLIPFDHPIHGKIQMPQVCNVCGKPATQFESKQIDVKKKISSQSRPTNLGGKVTLTEYAVKTDKINIHWCEEHWKLKQKFDRYFLIAFLVFVLSLAMLIIPLIWGVKIYESYGLLPLLLFIGVIFVTALAGMLFATIFASDDHPLWFRKLTKLGGGVFMWQSEDLSGNLVLKMARSFAIPFSELNRIESE